jgi:hypothetical protein
MPNLYSAKRRASHALVGSMRACIATDRLPIFATKRAQRSATSPTRHRWSRSTGLSSCPPSAPADVLLSRQPPAALLAIGAQTSEGLVTTRNIVR